MCASLSTHIVSTAVNSTGDPCDHFRFDRVISFDSSEFVRITFTDTVAAVVSIAFYRRYRLKRYTYTIEIEKKVFDTAYVRHIVLLFRGDILYAIVLFTTSL